ncbi:MAG: hypothetical protein ACOX2R_00465 [Anaerolineae bacterium]|jgi:hypothetical protein
MTTNRVDLHVAAAEMKGRADETLAKLEVAKLQAARWRARVDALTRQYSGYLFGSQNLASALSYEDDDTQFRLIIVEQPEADQS